MAASDSSRVLKKLASAIGKIKAAAEVEMKKVRPSLNLDLSLLRSLGPLLGWLDETIRCQHAVQRLCDSTAIGCLLSQHDDEFFIVDQNR